MLSRLITTDVGCYDLLLHAVVSESGEVNMWFFAQCHLACFLTRVVVSSDFWHSIALCSLLHAHIIAIQGVRVEY